MRFVQTNESASTVTLPAVATATARVFRESTARDAGGLAVDAVAREWTLNEADTKGAASSWFVNHESAVVTSGTLDDAQGGIPGCVAPMFPPQWTTAAPSDEVAAKEIELALLFDLPAGSIRLLCVDKSQEGGAMYTWHITRWLCKWSCADGKLIWKVRVAAAHVLLADGAYMRRQVVITASGVNVHVWDGKDGKCINVLHAIGRDVTALCANENYLCIAERKRVHIFTKNIETERLTPAFVFEPPISFVTSIAMTRAPDPDIVAPSSPQQSRVATCLTAIRHRAIALMRTVVPRASDEVLVCGGFRAELVSLHVGQRSSWKELNVRAFCSRLPHIMFTETWTRRVLLCRL